MHKKIISAGEGIKTEFKEAQNKLPKNLFETVCAFLNTEGGKIYLGVKDSGKISGIDKNYAVKLKTDIANLSNNLQKLEPVFMLYTKEIQIEGKTVLVIDVPESSQVHKTAGEIYVRNEDGDYKILQPEKIAAIVNRKLSYYTEQRLYPQITSEDLKPELFERTKRLIAINYPEHPWLELSFETFLQRAGFKRKTETGTEAYTLAAVLMFGTDTAIQTAAPAYKIDAMVRKQNIDRYDDRLTIRTNLINAYDKLMSFIAKHMNDPFYMEGTTRISLRDKIFRELVSNIIAHREYLDARPATVIIYKDKIIFSNPNIPRRKGVIDPKEFTPFSKNPTISKLMLQMGRVEEVGSGMRNVYKYLPHYSKFGKAIFKEDDIFQTTILLSGSVKDVKEMSEEMSEEILVIINKNPKITAKEIAEIVGKSPRTVERKIQKLKKAGILTHIGSTKSGHWKINRL